MSLSISEFIEMTAYRPFKLISWFDVFFTYKNALYLMIDVASFSNDDQTAWIEENLKNSDATWKFLYVHFPPFNEVEPYPEMAEKWVPIFDKYKLDFVMNGHFHYYLRTYPMKAGKIEKEGTIYMPSVGTTAARGKKNSAFCF